MKRVFAPLILLVVLVAAGRPGASVFAEEYKREVRIGRVQDMAVFKNELYILRTYTFTSTASAAIYKYVDEKTPPILQLTVSYGGGWKNEEAKSFYGKDDPRFKNKVHQLISLEIYNGQLYAGGPLGIFRLNEATGGWDYVEFGYGFDYVPESGMVVSLIKTIGADLYGILHYRGIFKDPGTGDVNEKNVTAFAKLVGNTWQLVLEPYPAHPMYEVLLFPMDLDFFDGKFVVCEDAYRVDVLVEGKTADAPKMYWEDITKDPDFKIGRFPQLAVFNNKLYACGETTLREKATDPDYQVYVLKGLTEDENGLIVDDDWEKVLEPDRFCEFIDVADGTLFIGMHLYYEKDQKVLKPLYRFDGARWEAIDFSNALGLSKGQVVDGVTAVESFNGKLFFAISTTYAPEGNPTFYILENGKLRPVVWYK